MTASALAHPVAWLNPEDDLDLLALIDTELELAKEHDPWIGEHGSSRPEQRPPTGTWTTWLLMAGRGFGKTRTGAEFIRDEVQSGRMKRIALVGTTIADVRDVMVEGESGLIAVCERAGMKIEYVPGKRRVIWPEYDAIATTYSAERPRQLRGPQHDGFWADEISSWKYAETWDQLMFGLRLGKNPRGVATTTPKPVQVVRDLVALIKDGVVSLTKGRTYDNAANLAPVFISQVIRKYEGTRLGRQELEGELLEDVEGALWQHALIDAARVRPDAEGNIDLPEMKRVAVAVDPATTHGEGADETGLAVSGLGKDGHYYVFHISGQQVSSLTWATKALLLYDEYQANEIVVEGNNGGELLVEAFRNACKALKRPMPKIRRIHVNRGKEIRAEPISLLYEQHRVHHVGTFGSAEVQMCSFPVIEDAGDDQVDALVHSIAALTTGSGRTISV